ncbi:hypothetical protein U9M48_038014 [Paspalum notatum var. saurae]|uniref:NB-ARC domain-containing protein n=1 Tax=Paspalum notatum var. saurae TaxID=547442 RepID=A0AAQ3XBQ5_PASNO
MCYQLFKQQGHGNNGHGSKVTAAAAEQSSVTAAEIFGVNEARLGAKTPPVSLKKKKKNEDDESLRVIAVWGTGRDLGQASFIRAAYENADSLVKQFNNSGLGVDGGVLWETDKTDTELAEEFNRYVHDNRYLIVLNSMSTIEQWDQIKMCLPDSKKGSRIIISTTQVEVASLCAGQEIQVLQLSQLSDDQTFYAFYHKDSQDGIESTTGEPSSNASTTSTVTEESANQFEAADGNNASRNSPTRIPTSRYSLEVSQLIGRDREKSDIMDLILNQSGQELPVISV